MTGMILFSVAEHDTAASSGFISQDTFSSAAENDITAMPSDAFHKDVRKSLEAASKNPLWIDTSESRRAGVGKQQDCWCNQNCCEPVGEAEEMFVFMV